MGLILYLQPQISSAEIFLIGAIAKAIATTATYPLQTVQAILRVNTMLYKISSFCLYSTRSKPLLKDKTCDILYFSYWQQISCKTKKKEKKIWLKSMSFQSLIPLSSLGYKFPFVIQKNIKTHKWATLFTLREMTVAMTTKTEV